MKINKQSNLYTIFYIAAIAVIVGAALAITTTALKPKQQANANADKMMQILFSIHIPATAQNADELFNDHITRQLIVDNSGKVLTTVKGNENSSVFDINVEQEAKLPDTERHLPVYVCRTDDGSTKYILPVYGAGLWGPIWGYVSVDSDGSTIYGAYFSHAGETPGLGAEIEKPAFQSQFQGKQLIRNDQFRPIAVVKSGQRPANGEDYVDGISGGTITSKGVGAMLDNCLSPYSKFLENLKNDNLSNK